MFGKLKVLKGNHVGEIIGKVCVYYLIRGKWSGLKASYNSALPLSLRWVRPPKPATGTELSRFSVRSLKSAQEEIEGKGWVLAKIICWSSLFFVLGGQKRPVFSHSHVPFWSLKTNHSCWWCYGGWMRALSDSHAYTHNFNKDWRDAKASGWIRSIRFQLRSLKHLKKRSKNGWRESLSSLMERIISSQNLEIISDNLW